MISFEDSSLLEELVANGVDDWVYEAWVYGNIASRVVSAPREKRAVALGLITEALLTGLMEAGETPPGEGGFVPWPIEPIEAVARICRTWTAREDPAVGPGEIVWLRNTPTGNALGHAVLERERG